MRTRSFTESELSGNLIQQEEDVVTMVVHGHPLTDDPVQLYVSRDEADSLDAGEQDFVTLELAAQGGEPRRLVMKQAAFDALFTAAPVGEVLAAADRYNAKRPGSQRSKDWNDYTRPETIGLIHKGLPSAKEKFLVKQHLEQANANRLREGQPEIDPHDAADVKRYGLEGMRVTTGPGRPVPRPQPAEERTA